MNIKERISLIVRTPLDVAYEYGVIYQDQKNIMRPDIVNKEMDVLENDLCEDIENLIKEIQDGK
jgi:hypothetical protein